MSKQFPLPRKKRESTPDPREDGRVFHAVRQVSFHCAAGEVLGLLGPNGAGKTTTLRMLSTALLPSGGSIEVNGIALEKESLEARRHVGFLSGSTALYGRLSVRENISLFGEAHGLRGAVLNSKIDALLERLDMTSYAGRRVETLSAGMKQRAAIARTAIHDPKVMILDEPTTGLDILGASVVMDFIRDCRDRGTAVVFSTHHLHEVEALCHRVAIIQRGSSVFEGTVDELRERGQGDLATGYLACLD